MEYQIVVCSKDDIRITAVFSDRICKRILIGKSDENFQVGDIYCGRIEKMVDNVKAAFVNIGMKQNVYVPYDKMKEAITRPGHADGKVHEGDTILVQIERMPSKNKPATAVGDFSLVGNSVILFHGRTGVSFSKKIENSAFRERMKEQFGQCYKNDTGIMFRTNAPLYQEEIIHTEIHKLTAAYEKLVHDFGYSVTGKCLYHGIPQNLTVFRDEYLSDISEIVTEEEDVYSYLKENPFISETGIHLRYEKNREVSLYHLYDMKKVLSEALARKVWLKSGGYLVIDTTEAMTVIDVNSGKASDAKNKKNLLHQVNLEAADEILHQISLRNLSGIIIVDFINTDGDNDSVELNKYLKANAKNDHGHTSIVDITKLGLVEITREKQEAPLSELVKSLGFIP